MLDKKPKNPKPETEKLISYEEAWKDYWNHDIALDEQVMIDLKHYQEYHENDN